MFKNNTGSETTFFDSVSREVHDLRLNSAFNILESEIVRLRASDEKPKLERMRETYRLMIRYLATGAPDPSRAEMTDTLRRDALAMVDRLEFRRLSADSPGSYYSTARVLSGRGRPLSALIEEFDKAQLLHTMSMESGAFDPDRARQYEESLQELFRSVMATPPGALTDEDVRMLVARASDPTSPFALASQIVSSLLIGMLEHYDRNRFVALLEVYSQSEEERVQAQALVAIVLSLLYHKDRPGYDRDLSLRLQSLSDDLTLYPRLRDIYYSLLQTQDTKRVLNYFQTQIVPQIQQMKPDELKKMMEGSLSPDALGNPEWAERLENSELGKKLKKLNEMQFDGADMMVMAFANLKMFPFFGSPGNWLLPFDANHTSVRFSMDEKLRPVTEFLEMADMMCDSDKYSFVMAIGNIPSDRREMMIGSLSANMETIKEQMDDFNRRDSRFRREVTRYLRNLYRLFTLSSQLFGIKRNTSADPVSLLESGFRILDLPYLGEVLAQRDVLEIGAEFQFSRKNYELAIPLLEELLKFDDADTGRIWEQLGYIYEKSGDTDRALDYYRKAELIKTDNPWLLRHLADMFESKGLLSEAADRYERLQSENDVDATALYAFTLLRLGKHDQAVRLFSKLNYEASEGQISKFSTSLQPDPTVRLTPADLTSFWLMLAEIERGDYLKAESHLTPALPESFDAYRVLFSFLQGNYALTVDGLKEFENRDRRIAAAKIISRYDRTLTSPSAFIRLNDFFTRHIIASGSSLTDFRLLQDSI